MMQPATEPDPQYDIGVLVGRFQVHQLHDAHRDLIQYVCDQHEKVVIFLGNAPLPTSTSNPLDFESRKQMILADFPNANVLYINDQPTDEAWSKRLDAQINDLALPGQTSILYGGRDSFIAHYKGKFPTQELMQETFMSGTEVRRGIAKSRTRANPAFRAGVIWASQARFPTAYQVVDVAVFNEDRSKILLGRKTTDAPGKYRLFGGFSDPRTPTLEQDARREVAEEAGIEIGDVKYVGSATVADWRYRNEPDSIKTALFTAKYLHGRPTPGDDIDEVRWFDLHDGELTEYVPDRWARDTIVPEHLPLMGMLVTTKED